MAGHVLRFGDFDCDHPGHEHPQHPGGRWFAASVLAGKRARGSAGGEPGRVGCWQRPEVSFAADAQEFEFDSVSAVVAVAAGVDHDAEAQEDAEGVEDVVGKAELHVGHCGCGQG